MRQTSISKIRNVGTISHIDAGKTTITERMLFYSGEIHKLGEVHHGEATMDWMPLERERGITITSAATTFHWKGMQINLIDTPGHVDFTAEVERSLRVLDGAIAIFCAVGGVQPQSEAVWHRADRYHVPRIAFINKMDRAGANFEAVTSAMRSKLGARPALLQIPAGEEETFRGVIDLVHMRLLEWEEADLGMSVHDQPVPPELQEASTRAREALVEMVAEEDEAAMEHYLSAGTVDPDVLMAGLRRATIACRLVPTMCGAALRNRGIQPLLDAVADLLPSPLEVPPVEGQDPVTGEREVRQSSSEDPLAALAFKVATDAGRRLTYLRIYSGSLSANASVYNVNLGSTERVARLFRMHANKRERLARARAGEIVAVAGLKETSTGHSLSSPERPILLEAMTFPQAVLSAAIETRTTSDQDKLLAALDKLTSEDPTFKATPDEETGQVILSGMGELHLDVAVKRLLQEFNVPVRIGRPQVVYRETITTAADVEEVFDRELAGKRHFAAVRLHLAARPRGSGNNIGCLARAEDIPEALVASVLEGIEQSLTNGPVRGFPIIDVEVVVTGGTYREGESTAQAYQIAAARAVQEGCQQAQPILLEPIMAVEVLVPEPFVGAVIGDLTSRSGKIEDVEAGQIVHVIHAQVPLSQLFGYSTDLRSASQGRGTYTMQFSHYDRTLVAAST